MLFLREYNKKIGFNGLKDTKLNNVAINIVQDYKT